MRLPCSMPGLNSVMVALLITTLSAAAQSSASGSDRFTQARTNYHWFSIQVHISGLPKQAQVVPVRFAVNPADLARDSGICGFIDERSVGLFRAEQEGPGAQEPLQLTPKPVPRPYQRRLSPGTQNVSYMNEYSASEAQPDRAAEWTLTWIARSDADGQARYRIEFGILKSGTHVQVPYGPYNYRSFDAEGHATPIREFPRMQIRPQHPTQGYVSIYDGRELVANYHTGPTYVEMAAGSVKYRRPFLYPLNGPGGIPLTEFGKPHDPTGSHAHHYSFWMAHASVSGLDFWSERRGGLILHENFEDLEDGPVFCRVVQNTSWNFDGTNVLAEKRILTVYRSEPEFRVLDVELGFTPATTNAVVFGKTSFGFLAARVAQSMSVFDGGGEILNSRGDLNERGAHLKHAEWIDQSGPVAPGEWAGLAILDHPANSGHPGGWHCRNDGWAGASFNLEGPYDLLPGRELVLQYRIVLHKHDATRSNVALRYRDYAAQPRISWRFADR